MRNLGTREVQLVCGGQKPTVTQTAGQTSSGSVSAYPSGAMAVPYSGTPAIPTSSTVIPPVNQVNCPLPSPATLVLNNSISANSSAGKPPSSQSCTSTAQTTSSTTTAQTGSSGGASASESDYTGPDDSADADSEYA